MKRLYLSLAAATLAAFVFADHPLSVDASGDRPAAPAASGPVAAPGMTVHIDPATGAPIEPTAEEIGTLLAPLAMQLSTSSEGLVEVASPVAGGGYMVDLQGRFQNVATAFVDENGNVHSPCVDHLPERAPRNAGADREVK